MEKTMAIYYLDKEGKFYELAAKLKFGNKQLINSKSKIYDTKTHSEDS